MDVKSDQLNRPIYWNEQIPVSGNSFPCALFSSPSSLLYLVLGVDEVREGAQLLQLVLVVIGLDDRRVFVANLVESVLRWRRHNKGRWSQPRKRRVSKKLGVYPPQPRMARTKKRCARTQELSAVPAKLGKRSSSHLENTGPSLPSVLNCRRVIAKEFPACMWC